MKKLSEIKQSKTINDIFIEGVNAISKNLVGRIFRCKKFNYEPVLILNFNIPNMNTGILEFVVLHNEQKHIFHFSSWRIVADNFVI